MLETNRNWTRWVLQTAQNWDDLSYVIHETGIAHIDHEHKRMTDYMVEINRLLFELEKEFSIDIFDEQRKIMTSFYEYTAIHCNNEEKFIEKYNLPGLDIQRREHKKLLSIMRDIIFQFKTGRVTSAFRHRINLLEVVVNHMNTVDKKVFDFSNISDYLVKMVTWSDINTFIRLVHIPKIDKQHKLLTEKIIDLANFINKANGVSIDNLELKELLMNILEYTKLHFDTEIKIIRDYKIPGEDEQNTQHNTFINLLEDSIKSINKFNATQLLELKQSLLLWWIKHINIYDYRTFRKYDWLKSILLTAEKVEDVSWLIAKMGIEEVDKDHMHFLDILFNNLDIFEHSDDVNSERRIEGLNELYTYAEKHFEREEVIMKKNEVLDREQHTLEHRSILKSLKNFTELNSSHKVDLSSAFKRKILSIWISHINDTDTGTFGVYYE